MRDRTDSTLHWIGCPSDGCNPNEWYCTYDENNETLEFGSNGGSAVRSMPDPNDENGDTMPNNYNGCCSQPLGLCNAPDTANNGVGGLDNAEILCKALGYETGQFLETVMSNSCPESHAVDEDGLEWDSDWVNSQGLSLIHISEPTRRM